MSEQVKLAIIYYSSTGNITTLARAAEVAGEKAGAEVRLRQVEELAPEDAIQSNPAWAANRVASADVAVATPDDIDWADAVLFGTPTRFGNVSSQLKQYIDTLGGLWSQGRLADKVYAGFTSTSTAHGGQESTLLALYNTIHHFGGILVAPGFTAPVMFAQGNPYGVSHVSGNGDQPVGETELGAIEHSVQRLITVAARLKAGAAA